MPKITLNFFGEKANIDIPKLLSGLRNQISKLFCFSKQEADEILLTYDLNGEKKPISNDQDLKTFLNSKVSIIDLDISQTSKIYTDNLNKLKEENHKDEEVLKALLKKDEELQKKKHERFALEKKELKAIDAQIIELFAKKNEIQKKMFLGIQEINNELIENDKKIREIQKKLGVPEKETKKAKFEKMLLHCKNRHCPPKKMMTCPNENLKAQPNVQPNKEQILRARPRFCPPIHPCFFERKYRGHPNKKKLEVKFAKTEYIDIPKNEVSNEESKNESKNESNNDSNNELDLKLRTIDDWGKCLLLRTKEITNRLAEKFKGLETLNLNISLNSNNENKKEEKKEDKKEEKKEKKEEKKEEKEEKKEEKKEKSIEKIKPKKIVHGDRPEGVPKKLCHCPTEGNIFEKEKIPSKIMHFGVKCDQCGQYPIRGIRYKCSVCPNFDFCENCEKKYAEAHNHAFYKINNPSMRRLIAKTFIKK